MRHRRACVALCLLVLVGPLIVSGCGLFRGSEVHLTIVSGSENESLEPLVANFARRRGYDIEMTYMGSVDMMLAMSTPEFAYDAVWPAHSLWIALGDEDLNRVRHEESIMRSPVVFGIRKSLAEELGFVGCEVTVGDILAATERGNLRFMMTNATQSNSGATAYLGFLYSFLGQPDVITEEDLCSEDLRANMTALLSAVNRSSGSSGWLKDLYLESGARYDGMVNYEALIIEANQELLKEREEPLYVVYPVDGQAIADSPLGYVDKGDPEKERVFLELQEYLLSEDVQAELLKNGRRTGLVGMTSAEVDKRVFNPDWGIDTERVINQIRLPAPDVVREALRMYQEVFRKPSFTVFALDYSGSMEGEGERTLEAAMTLLLDQERASEYMLQTGPSDVTVVIPFAGRPLAVWATTGNDQDTLNGLLTRIVRADPGGDTDIYLPVLEALDVIKEQGATPDTYQTAIILMTDGRSNSEGTLRLIREVWDDEGWDVPVFGILFGDADAEQVEAIAELTRGRVFDGTQDLVSAFRKAKGYN